MTWPLIRLFPLEQIHQASILKDIRIYIDGKMVEVNKLSTFSEENTGMTLADDQADKNVCE